jgi:hypothetical protein
VDLERVRTLAANWEMEVVAVRNNNLELHSLLRGRRLSRARLRRGRARSSRRPRRPTN